MDSSIFRKSSVERVNSPEQLNNYIRVMSPSVWIVLAAVVIFLLGIIVWSVFGSISTTIPVGTIVSDGDTICLVTPEKIDQVKLGMTVEIKNTNGEIVNGVVSSIASAPQQQISAGDDTFASALFFSGFDTGDFFYVVQVNATGISDGVYSASIQVEEMSPISFIID